MTLRDGDERITDYLMEKYKDLVRQKAKSMYLLGADGDDLIQEGMIGLFKALRDYDPGRDASFKTFAELCISRQMFTAVENSHRKKHGPLNSYISLSTASSLEEGEDRTLMERLTSLTDKNPEEMVLDRERFESLRKEIQSVLSPLENQVFGLSLTGMNYTEIARVLGRDEKSTDNALQRIKGKVKKVLSNREN